MKKILSLLLVLCMLVAFVPNINVFAHSAVPCGHDIFIDTNEKITTGTEYNNNFISVFSDCDKVATADFNTSNGVLTIKGIKSGKANITLRLGKTDNYTDYIYTVNVTSVFSNVTFSYDYDKITVNYDKDALPKGCIPVFSTDGENWQESNTLTRNKMNDGIIYKAFKVKIDDQYVVMGSMKPLVFNARYNEISSNQKKDIELIETCSYDLTDIIGDNTVISYTCSSNVINYSTSINTIYANKSGTAICVVTLYVGESDYNEDGSRTREFCTYTFNVTVYTEEGEVKDNTDNNTNNTTNNNNNSNNTSNNNTNNKKIGSWMSDGKGWWYAYTDGSYLTNTWKQINGEWYYFGNDGYMESNCYRDGYWINADGTWNPNYTNGKWCSNSVGWWFEDSNWYPTNQWLKINGDWYYFKSNGYMACNEYIDGYWCNASGVCQ